ncbi:uncharacterized protein BP01DRAFT_177189 [Aspergillus saccharolyticus JOP 1030-1]|uniref:Mso1 N-terminal domain-containing protein n=1 Tax=Aspergillus saccharolyticus JOP 1030-1 TaxID=1450539 RepID=A0A318ZKS0_9EURO|nr:hypothetical protein BP01DRAFT_177189 [Aspergillus saccharolyticus JOP 1030-1]PYH48169.1 hypothetical protein BP01DRAFT_177189 [Aspergillus saccharolyticus JOP 1030-1]
MTSYFSSLTSSSAISNLGTRLNSLKRAITSGDERDDPDNEDCSHISNVLRAYYTEKGRPYPSWLPPDPKAPAPAPSRVIATSQIQPGAPGGAPASSAYGRGGGLGDLWGDAGAATPPTSQTSSLRRGRMTGGGANSNNSTSSLGAPLSATASAPGGPVAHNSLSPSPSAMQQHPHHPAGGRPLPSQRAGSYQTISGPVTGGSTQPLERAASAQERLRARLHGGRSPSPGQSPSSRPGSPYVADPSARKPVGMPGRR